MPPKPKNPKAVITRVITTDESTLTLSTAGTKAAPSSYLTEWGITWGDGLYDRGNGNPPPQLSHKYDAEGSYNVDFTVNDRNGRIDSMPGAFIIRAQPPVPPSGGLLQRSNLQFLGAFRVANDGFFNYFTAGLAYNPANNSLFTGGGYYSVPAADQEPVSEITIPAIITPDLNSVVRANLLQPFTDATEGNNYKIGLNGQDLLPTGVTIHRGGLLVYNNRLIGTTYVEYDAAVPPAGQLSHWYRSLNLSTTGSYQGAYQLGNLGAAFYAGYMCTIPASWQARLGGPALTGAGGYAVISRTSYGPSLHVFDPDSLSGPTGSAYPATTVVNYPDAHQNLGRWDNAFPANPNPVTNIYYNAASSFFGAVFPEGHDTVLVFGNIGYGLPGYGVQTTDPAQNWQPVGDGSYYIYDLYSNAHATHSWPYHNQIWAYDANDLYRVKQGIMNPWDVTPYALWDITTDLPVHDGYPSALPSFGAGISGAAYDPSTQRIFLMHGNGADLWVPGAGAFSYPPLIKVYQIV